MAEPIMKRLKAAADELAANLADQETLAAQTKALKQREMVLAREILPDLMKEIGVANFTTLEGKTFVLSQGFDGGFISGREAEAQEWLRANGHGGIMRCSVTVDMPSNIDEPALDRVVGLIMNLRSEESAVEGAVVNSRSTVHPQTWKAWLRERMLAGDELPEELFKVTPYEFCKVS